jgi:sulfate permease, SulP family
MTNLLALFRPRIGLDNLRDDLFGGLTAAVVALPLALAFGVASGAGAIAGLYGAIAVGFFAAIFGGTPAQVSGPTGPMTVVMAAIVATHAGNMAEAFTIVMLGGLVMMAFGVLRLGRYIVYTPISVVSGFMTGIGIIIILLQTVPFFGLPAAGGPMASVEAWPRIPAELDLGAAAVGALALAIMVFWPARLRAIVPPPLAALVLGTVAALVAFPSAPILGDIPTGLPELVVPTIALDRLPEIVQGAFVLAILGAIDSLLTSLVADQVTRTRHDSDKELVGQGIGNAVAGLIGGLPGAGATMRTVVNIRAGGRTQLSGALHAIVLLALALGLAPLAENVPHAVLAGILLKVGWDIVDWSYLKRLRRMPREKVVVMLVTLALTVFVDLITAVAVGIILASFVNARAFEKEQLAGIARLANGEDLAELPADEQALLKAAIGRVTLWRFRGPFSYASARQLITAVRLKADEHDAVIFDFTDTGYVDVSAALALEELLADAVRDGERIYLSGMSSPGGQLLERLGVSDQVPPAQRFPTRAEAVRQAVAATERAR